MTDDPKYRSIQNKPANQDVRLIQGDHCVADNVLHEFYEGDAPPRDMSAFQAALKRDRKYRAMTDAGGMNFEFGE